MKDPSTEDVLRSASVLISSLVNKPIFEPLGKEVRFPGNPLILVHPFYYGDEDQRKSYYLPHGFDFDVALKQDYLENMRKFLSEFQGNIYLYESDLRIQGTKRILGETRRSLDGVYYLETGNHDSFPQKILKREDYIYLRNLGRAFFFAGGRIFHSSSKDLFGCLGGLVSNLSKLDVKGEFVKGCCFT